MKELKSAERRFEKAEAQHLKHQQVDLPEYRRWHHLTLGPSEQEILRQQGEFRLFAQFLDGLQQEQLIQGRPAKHMLAELLAYAEAHDDGAAINRMAGEWSPAYLMSCGNALWLEPRTRMFEAEREKFNRQREKRETRARNNGRQTQEGDFEPSPARPAGAAREQEFRTLYRALCRALHPDVAGEGTPARYHLWLEVQDAYEAHNLERMEALHAAWELKTDPQGQRGSCAQIIAATKKCLAGLRSLQRELRSAKKHLSWQFASLDEAARTRQAERLVQEMRREARGLKMRVDAVRREYVGLMKSVRLPRMRKSGPPRFAGDEEPFGFAL